MKKSRKPKIVAALSGGVDSAVAAHLLKGKGRDVVGVYFRFFDAPQKQIVRVRKIAGKIGIPLKTIDARGEFKRCIIERFIKDHEKGLTPNPCVFCNQEMKFRLLSKLLKKYKADFIATGHYVRLRRKFKIQNSKFKIKEKYYYKLLEAADKSKGQSYFLHRLTQKDLAKIIFPLGDCTKAEVKRMAKKLKMPAGDKESQDICFLQGANVNTYLNKYLKPKPGNIVDTSGKVLGRHSGLPLYTIGQRQGIRIGGTGPYFVLRKNTHQNELVVTKNTRDLLAKSFFVHDVNWIAGVPKLPLRAKVQIRYRAPKINAMIKPTKGSKLVVKTEKSLRAVTPGQSAVFYKRKEVLGGGLIIM